MNTVKISRSLVKAFIGLVLEKHKTKSYREIIRENYTDIVKVGTLGRIIKTKGKYLPKNKDILFALGLAIQEKQVIQRPKWLVLWNHLPKEERQMAIKNYLLEKGFDCN